MSDNMHRRSKEIKQLFYQIHDSENHDGDVNAAINIRDEVVRIAYGTVGATRITRSVGIC